MPNAGDATERHQQREHEQLTATRAQLVARARAEFAPNHPTAPGGPSSSATAPHEITSSAEIYQRALERARAERARAERAGRGDLPGPHRR